MAQPALSASVTESSHLDAELPRAGTSGLQVLKFVITDQKEVEVRLPARLNEQDILLLRAQIDYLELQVQMNRPDQPVRLDLYRSNHKR